MSTGQRQRVKLAQAIAHGPSLVLLDEPTDGLDPVQRDEMLELIRRIGTEFGINVLLSSHLLEEVERIADNVVIISGGKAVASGPIEALRSGRGGVLVTVAEGADQLVTVLEAQGLDVEVDGQRLTVGQDRDPDEIADQVRDALVQTGAPLRKLVPRQQSLEDLFLEEVYTS